MNDDTPVKEIIRPLFKINDDDEKKDYEGALKLLHDNSIRRLGQWKNIKNPELKKRFSVVVINALDTAAGTVHFGIIFVLTFT